MGTLRTSARKHWVVWLTVILLFFCFQGSSGASDIDTAKENLLKKIDGEKEDCKKASLGRKILGRWNALFSMVCKQIDQLNDLVDETPSEKLPDALVNIYIDELTGGPTKGRYPPMGNYLQSFGEPAVVPLMNRFNEIPDPNKHHALITLGEIGSEKALPLIRSRLSTLNLWTLQSSATALRMILKEDAKKELLPVLKDPRLDPKGIRPIVNALSSLEDPGWYDAILDLAEAGTIDIMKVYELNQYEKYPEPIVVKHVDYLLSQWNSDKSMEHTAAACLLFQFQNRQNLKKLRPILDDLLHAKFQYPKYRFSPPYVHCRAHNKPKQPTLLDRIENTLTPEDIKEWMEAPQPSWLSTLYLGNLCNKKGGQPVDYRNLLFHLKISVYDDNDGALLGEISMDCPYGIEKKKKIRLEGIHEKPYTVIVDPIHIDQERWRIKIPYFHVENPVRGGCAFPLDIPLESSTYQKLTYDVNGVKRTTKWVVKHSGPPPIVLTASPFQALLPQILKGLRRL